MDARAEGMEADSLRDETCTVQWDTSMLVGLFSVCLSLSTAFSGRSREARRFGWGVNGITG